jgi:excisionase family DNA binding protein
LAQLERVSVNSSELHAPYLTVAEVAELLKLNQQTVRNWIDQGSLPALRVGRRVRIKRSDLERMLDEGYSSSASERPPPGPSAEDFWGGEPVGLAEPSQSPQAQPTPNDPYSPEDISTPKSAHPGDAEAD